MNETLRRTGGWKSDARSPAVDAEIPGNPKRAGLDSHGDLIAGLEALVIVGIHGEALVILPRAPTTHDEPPRSAHNAGHIVASVDDCRGLHKLVGRIRPAIPKQ